MEDQGEIELGGLLAIGGFGVVFRAFHRGIDKPLVVKLSHSGVQPALHAGRMYCHSFTGPLWEIETTAEVANYVLRQEIGWLQRYRGPYIVPVIAAGELMDGVVYCVMPYIGPSAEVLQWDNKLQLTNVIRAAEALLWLEEQGAQHGDFKPGNVLVSDDGDVRLINPATRLQKTPFPAGDSGPDMGTPTYHWSSYHSRRQDVVGLATWIYLLLTGGFPGGIWHSASDAHMAPKRFFFGRHVLLPGEIGLSALFDDLIRETFSQMSSESISSVRPWVDRLHTKDAADVLTHGNGSEIHLPSGRSDICQQYATKMSVRCAMHGCGSKTPCRIGQHLINDFEWGRLRWLGGYSTVYAHQL
jgi:serine/threonine protein kinase